MFSIMGINVRFGDRNLVPASCYQMSDDWDGCYIVEFDNSSFWVNFFYLFIAETTSEGYVASKVVDDVNLYDGNLPSNFYGVVECSSDVNSGIVWVTYSDVGNCRFNPLSLPLCKYALTNKV